jgi:hypothetical protein
MSKILTSENYIINDHHITYDYKDGEVDDVTIFSPQQDVGIIFSGSLDEAKMLWETLDEMQLGDL